MGKKKIIILSTVIILLIGGISYYFVNRSKIPEITEINIQEEISEEQLRQTIISLYFRNLSTGELQAEGKLIDVKLLLEDPYIVLMNCLLEGPKNDSLESLIPEGTVVNSIVIEKDILYIDLSKEFVDNHVDGEKEQSDTIYSIVNTMIQLTEVNGIKISIDGDENTKFKDGKLSLGEIYVKII